MIFNAKGTGMMWCIKSRPHTVTLQLYGTQTSPKALPSSPQCVRVTKAGSGALSDAQKLYLCVISSETMGEGRSVALSYETYMSSNVVGSAQPS